MAKLVAEGLEGEIFKVFMNILRQEFGPNVLSIDSMAISTLQGRHIWNIFSQFSRPGLQTQPAVDERPNFIKCVMKMLISNSPREHHYVALY